jgi:sulfate transport system substrate-binding protein
VVDARGSRELAEAYLDYLYSPEGQEILASHANRVHDEEVRGAPCRPLSEVRLVRSRDVFGGWEQVSASTSPTRQAG